MLMLLSHIKMIPVSKPYNLGTGCGYSVLDMIEAFSKAANRSIPYQIAGRRPGDIACNYADANLAKEKLGWQTELELDDMTKDTWNWQTKYPSGLE